MKSNTSVLVDGLLQILASGAIYNKQVIPNECLAVLINVFSNQDDLLVEYHRLLNHMKRVGLIQREKLSDGHSYIMLTAKGKKRLRTSALHDIFIPNQKTWDEKWRVLSFDIPRDMSSRRYEFLRELHRLGFEKVLQSMWVYPFPCEAEVKQLATQLGLQESIVYLEAKLDVENHKYLKRHFAHLI